MYLSARVFGSSIFLGSPAKANAGSKITSNHGDLFIGFGIGSKRVQVKSAGLAKSRVANAVTLPHASEVPVVHGWIGQVVKVVERGRRCGIDRFVSGRASHCELFGSVVITS